MSFWKKLFGGGGEDAPSRAAASGAHEDYKGFTIRAALMPVGSEYQLAGSVEKEVGGELKRHDFVRADRFSSKDEAESFALAKGRQIVDEQGEGMFSQTWPAKPN